MATVIARKHMLDIDRCTGELVRAEVLSCWQKTDKLHADFTNANKATILEEFEISSTKTAKCAVEFAKLPENGTVDQMNAICGACGACGSIEDEITE